MRTFIGFFILILLNPVCLAQDLTLTFTAFGEAAQIDSITATNLNTGLGLTFPGNGTLRLNRITGNVKDPAMLQESAVFPNPFPGKAYLSLVLQSNDMASIRIMDITGQVLAHLSKPLRAGNHRFEVSVSNPGIYFIETANGNQSSALKVISTFPGDRSNSISHEGIETGTSGREYLLKSAVSDYILGYKAGDLLHFRCFAGTMTTVLTDSPAVSKNLPVGFAACQDPHGRNYAIVKIGDQTWMAENLAFLTTVRPATDGSVIWPYSYVYGFEGTNVPTARAHPNFTTYGVLYNWAGAMTGMESSDLVPSGIRGICPEGWHLPSNGEWSILTDFLGDSAGTRLKDAGAGFWEANEGGATNESGFGAISSGIRMDDPAGFFNLGNQAAYWSSTEGNASFAWYRLLESESPEMTRYGILKANGYSVRCVKD